MTTTTPGHITVANTNIRSLMTDTLMDLAPYNHIHDIIHSHNQNNTNTNNHNKNKENNR